MIKSTFLIEENKIKLQGRLNFQSVPDIQRQFVKLLPMRKSWVIDLAGVTFSDSAGLALLTECVRLSQRYQFTVSFAAMPLQMLAMANVTGLIHVIASGLQNG